MQDNSEPSVANEQKDSNLAAAPPTKAPPTATPTALSTDSLSEPGTGFWNITSKDLLENGVTILQAWPLAILLIVLILRKQIKPLFDRILKASGFGVEVEFDKRVDKLTAIAEGTNLIPGEPVPAIPQIEPTVERPVKSDGVTGTAPVEPSASDVSQTIQRDEDAKVQSLAKTFPSAAVVVAYAGLEAQAKAVGTALRIDPPTVDKVISDLVAREQLHPAAKSIAKELRTLRNTAAHNPSCRDF